MYSCPYRRGIIAEEAGSTNAVDVTDTAYWQVNGSNDLIMLDNTGTTTFQIGTDSGGEITFADGTIIALGDANGEGHKEGNATLPTFCVTHCQSAAMRRSKSQ